MDKFSKKGGVRSSIFTPTIIPLLGGNSSRAGAATRRERSKSIGSTSTSDILSTGVGTPARAISSPRMLPPVPTHNTIPAHLSIPDNEIESYYENLVPAVPDDPRVRSATERQQLHNNIPAHL